MRRIVFVDCFSDFINARLAFKINGFELGLDGGNAIAQVNGVSVEARNCFRAARAGDHANARHAVIGGGDTHDIFPHGNNAAIFHCYTLQAVLFDFIVHTDTILFIVRLFVFGQCPLPGDGSGLYR